MCKGEGRGDLRERVFRQVCFLSLTHTHSSHMSHSHSSYMCVYISPTLFVVFFVFRQRDALLPTIEAGKAAVLISHMWVTRALLGEALGEDDPLAVDVPTASVSCVEYPVDGGKPRVVHAPIKPEMI